MGEMIYLWRIASNCPDSLIAIHDRAAVDPILFRKAAIVDLKGIARFMLKGMQSAILGQHYFPNSAMLPLVSKEVGFRLNDLAGAAVQIVPALITCDDGEVEASLINPLESIPAVDKSMSEILYIPGTTQVMKFTKLQLLSGALNSSHLARLDEFRPFLLASESVKNLFASTRLCEFALPSDIRA